MGRAVTLFASSHLRHPMAKAIRRVSGEDWSHAGLRYECTKTFEARLRVGSYSWLEYHDGEHRLAEVELTRVNDAKLLRALYEIKTQFNGDFYGVGQLLAMLPWALWRRVGVKRAQAVTDALVCSELVWHFIDAVGSPYQALLRLFWQKDEFTPWDIVTFARTNPDICKLRIYR